MTCVNCGVQVEKSDKFCQECGSSLIVQCDSCGTELRSSVNFCSTCGTRQTSSMTAVFPDKYLDVAVLKARNRPEGTLTRADLKGLRELKAVHIKDLAGLEYAVNLTHLDLEMQLYDNQIKDISPLGSLTNLTKLELRSTRIEDIGPLGSLTNLTELDLRGNLLNDYAINRQIPAFKAKGIDVGMETIRK